jgi:hypothetical protein
MRADIAAMFSDVRTTTGQRPNNDTHYKRNNNVGDYTTIAQKTTYRADL